MAVEGLEIVIGADVADAFKGIDGLEKKLRGLGESGKVSLRTLQLALANVDKQIKVTTDPKQFERLSASAAKLRASITNLTNGGLAKLNSTGNQSTQVLSNLSRIAQDAPFGFLGIANNINPLIESFQRLQVSAKQTGKSLISSLGSALTGPAGIGLAIGLSSSLLLAFGDDIKKLLVPTSELGDAIDKAADGIDKEASSVIVMVKALQSGTLSSQEFKKVKKELIEQAPEFQSSFDGDKISIEASDKALVKYIEKLTTTVRVTAALGIVNESLAKSIRAIAKGEDFSFFEGLSSFFESGFSGLSALAKTAEKSGKNVQKALDSLKPGNITKLLEDTFKKLGITYKDFDDTIDDAKKKTGKTLDQLNNELVSKAKLFTKEFGDAFVVPDLEDSFFKTKEEILKASKKLLSDIDKFIKGDQTALKIKLPIVFTTETKLNDDDLKKFLRGQITRDQVRETIVKIPVVSELDFINAENLEKQYEAFTDSIRDRVLADFRIERNIPVDVTIDPTLSKDSIKQTDDLIKQFAEFGDKGLEAFIKAGIGAKSYTEALQDLKTEQGLQLAFANAIGDSFQSVFDNIRDGGNVLQGFFKSLGQSLENLISKLAATAAAAAILNIVSGGSFAGAKGFGGIFKSLLGFAEGGVVSSPTLAMIGEGSGTRNSNPEIVAPLNKLKDLIGNSGSELPTRIELFASGGALKGTLDVYGRRAGQGF